MTPQSIEIEEIGQMDESSREAGVPVFKAENNAGSYIYFAFLESISGLTIYKVESNRYGDFKRLMNRIIDQFQAGEDTQVTFVNVISEWLPKRNLGDVLQGFERETWEAQEGPHEGEEYDVLTGIWRREN